MITASDHILQSSVSSLPQSPSLFSFLIVYVIILSVGILWGLDQFDISSDRGAVKCPFLSSKISNGDTNLYYRFDTYGLVEFSLSQIASNFAVKAGFSQTLSLALFRSFFMHCVFELIILSLFQIQISDTDSGIESESVVHIKVTRGKGRISWNFTMPRVLQYRHFKTLLWSWWFLIFRHFQILHTLMT